MDESGRRSPGVIPGVLPDPPRSILIVMLSALGDAVMVLPVAQALKRALPDTHLTWVLQPGPHELVAGHPAVDDFVLFPRRRAGRSSLALPAGMEAIRSTAGALARAGSKQPGGRFDLLLDLQAYLKAGLLTALTPARIKLGFDRSRARDLNWIFTTHRIPAHPTGSAHVQDQYFEFLRHLGVDPEPVEYGLQISEEEGERQAVFFSRFDRPACALVLGSSDPRKNWSAEGYAAVTSALTRDLGLQPVLVGGRSSGEETLARYLLNGLGTEVVDARGGGLRKLLWILQGSAVVVSPDTGPLHMARALGVPTVGLFGFTNPKRSGPYRLFSELVVDGYATFPGEEYEPTRKKRRNGMARITPSMVLEKVAMAMAGRKDG